MTPVYWLLIDILLASALLTLGSMVLLSRHLRKSILLYLGFGLLMTLIWVRLLAPDLALAEAAIGTGLTVVLFLRVLADMEPHGQAAHHSALFTTPLFWLGLIPAGGLVMLLMGFFWPLVVEGNLIPTVQNISLAEQVHLSLDKTGVENPVTAVLLNYRAYDTMLELAVLLAAILGLGTQLKQERLPRRSPAAAVSVLRWIAPLAVLTSGYLLWQGADSPGGAFQAGAMLAGTFSMLYLAGLLSPEKLACFYWPLGLTIGITAFAVSAFSAVLAGLPVFTVFESWAGLQILLVETAATFAVAATLSVAVLGGMPATSVTENS